MVFFRGPGHMAYDDLSLKRADSAFEELYARFESGEVGAGTIEAAALLLDHVVSRFHESYYRPHLERTTRLLVEYLDPSRADRLGYDALLALLNVLGKSRDLFSASTRETINTAAETVLASLAKTRGELGSPAENLEAGNLFIPLVHQPLKSLPSLLTGQMVQGALDIEVTGEWSLLRKRKPVIAFDGKILESQGPFARQLRAAAAIADDIFICDNAQRELARLPRHYLYSFLGSGAETARTYTGGSAGLGFALLTLNRLETLGLRRRQRRLKSRTAITGYLGPEGSVLPVDNAGLTAKLKSVFFSSCTHFVIPDENRAAAEATLAKLHEEFPARRLELVPVSSVEEAYRDDRIFELAHVSAGTVALKKMERKRKYVVAGASLLAAVIVMLLLIPPMFMKEISTFYVRNDVLHFENRFGVVFDTFAPGYHIFKCENKEPGLPPGLIQHEKDSPPIYAYNGFYEDITSDDGKEFLFVALEVDPTEKTPAGRIHIHLLSKSRKPLLHITLSDTLRMLENDKLDDHIKVNLTWNGFHDFDHDGRKELYIVARNHVLSPTVVHCVSLENGSIQTFAHYGYFNAFRIHDYNGDGSEEIILAGVHGDPLNRGVVAVLDPLDMQGTTPTGLDPSFVDFKDDAALLYIMFPKTVMCDLLGGECSRPHAMTINPSGNSATWFGVQEGETGLMYYFDPSWRCNDIQFITTYESRYRAFEKIHDLTPMDAYREELRREVRYWDRDEQDWVTSPP